MKYVVDFVNWVRYTRFSLGVVILVWVMWLLGLGVFIPKIGGYFAIVSIVLAIFVTLRRI